MAKPKHSYITLGRLFSVRTGKEIRFRFGSSEDKAGKEAKCRPYWLSSPSFADTAGRSRSQPKMEDNLFTSPKESLGQFFAAFSPTKGYMLPPCRGHAATGKLDCVAKPRLP